jgi:hypothetical protein
VPKGKSIPFHFLTTPEGGLRPLGTIDLLPPGGVQAPGKGMLRPTINSYDRGGNEY